MKGKFQQLVDCWPVATIMTAVALTVAWVGFLLWELAGAVMRLV